ncbi:glycoside hydrolase family 3 C-terminal domain-containing protein [Streptomyces mutabilis]|uniref:glycoside hydrolase family 3 C-terminal domain-containing protein n=1 Tax=Streptomyces mutabilis TaxID=67332 RepID=UPI00364EB4A7
MTPTSDAARLLAQMTLEEKASLCLGSTFWCTAPVPRLGIPAVMLADGPHGLRRQPGTNQPGVSGSLPATCFPTASALGSSWNPDLVRRVGAAIGTEARAQGVSVVLGPGINIKRSPLCGRNFEYYSEDPLLSGALGAAFVAGVQSQGVGTAVKHFAVNNQETDRLRVSADVDERTMREIYLPAFEHVVTEARPWAVMCAYNRVNGVHASEHQWLLSDVLRDEWGFDGVVMSDWGAVHDRVAALRAGLDLEMPPNIGISDKAVVTAVHEGRLDEAVLDEAALRLLRMVERASNTEVPEVASAEAYEEAHHRLARAAAAECAVLLKNEDGVLPLDLTAGQTIAVIGAFAVAPRFQGAGSSRVNPTRVDSILDEMRAAAPEGVDIAYAEGYPLDAGDHGEALRDRHASPLASEAVALAERASVVIACLALPPSDESEGFDRRHLDLPGEQTDLLAELAEVNPNVVVVLANGGTVCVTSWERHCKAVLECWLSGQAAGGALADLLFGRANPSGRLAETVPVRLQDTPAYLNFPGEAGHVRYGEGVFVGYRAYDATDREVSYPFGHGLSYTTFAYTDLNVTVTGRPEDGDLLVAVSCTIRNTGDRAGHEVVQLYVGDPEAQVARPVRELKGFTKLHLQPGASGTATFQLGARDLSYWSSAWRRWVLEGGQFDLAVGASSRDLRLAATIDITAPAPLPRLDGMATLNEWLAHPEGSRALRETIGTDADGNPRGILSDPERCVVEGNFPLSTLATFPGTGFDHNAVDELTRRFAAQADPWESARPAL